MDATYIIGVLLGVSIVLNIFLLIASSELQKELGELKYGTRLSQEELEQIRKRLMRFKE